MREKGYTLIELLVVTALIGIIVAIAVPNLISAMQRARQKRTMADMRAVCEGIEMYSVDMNHFPVYTTVNAEALAGDLVIYMKRFNSRDGWNTSFTYDSNGRNYTVSSRGSDRYLDDDFIGGPTTDYRNDIVFSDGVFVQWPEGVQRSPTSGIG